MDLTSLFGGGGGSGVGGGEGGGGSVGSPGSASGKGSTSAYSTSGGNTYGAVGITTGQLALLITLGGIGLAMIGLVLAAILKK